MEAVHVKFPDPGDPVVTEDQQAIISGDMIAWHFTLKNRDIDQVRIEFESPEEGGAPPAFFLGGQPYHSQTNPVFYDSNKVGRALIWGIAPITKEGEPSARRRDKYTISGLKGGTVVTSLDPEIITDPPIPIGGP